MFRNSRSSFHRLCDLPGGTLTLRGWAGAEVNVELDHGEHRQTATVCVPEEGVVHFSLEDYIPEVPQTSCSLAAAYGPLTSQRITFYESPTVIDHSVQLDASSIIVSGTVQGVPEGTPFSVVLLGRDSCRSRWMSRGVTDRDGRFRVAVNMGAQAPVFSGFLAVAEGGAETLPPTTAPWLVSGVGSERKPVAPLAVGGYGWEEWTRIAAWLARYGVSDPDLELVVCSTLIADLALQATYSEPTPSIAPELMPVSKGIQPLLASLAE